MIQTKYKLMALSGDGGYKTNKKSAITSRDIENALKECIAAVSICGCPNAPESEFVKLLNHLIELVRDKIKKDETIRLYSFGSGGLGREYLMLFFLIQEGYSGIVMTCIDKLYGPTYAGVFKDFKDLFINHNRVKVDFLDSVSTVIQTRKTSTIIAVDFGGCNNESVADLKQLRQKVPKSTVLVLDRSAFHITGSFEITRPMEQLEIR